MSALCGLTLVKDYLEITDIAGDTLISELISGHSAFVENYCSRSFAASSYLSEKFSLESDLVSKIKTKHYPIISVASLIDNGATIPVTDYQVDKETGIIELKEAAITQSIYGRYFSKGVGKVVISYRAGYETIPKDLEISVARQVAKIYSLKDHDGMKSEKMGSYSFTKQEGHLLPEVKAVYDHYVKVI